MILSDKEILREMRAGNIVISPFRRCCLGSNSYDIHLGKTLAIYKDEILDAKKENVCVYIEIPPEGFVLRPNELYLGITEEYNENHKHVPFLEGKSSIGRLGIDIHATAGKGDVGFCNHWTLEMSVKRPVRIYAGMPIGQIIFFKLKGEAITPYNKKPTAKYNNPSAIPMPSMIWKEFLRDKEQTPLASAGEKNG
jgi:dCTP deaminase